MKTGYMIRFVAAALMLLAPMTVAAQALRTGYFLKGYSYRHRLNPALMNDQHYISFPLLGSTNLNTSGALGLSDLLYESPDGNGLVTFMHPSVSTDNFMERVEAGNRLALELDLNVFSVGFFGLGGYNTFDVALHSNTGLNVPYDVFSFLKAMDGGAYNFANLNIASRNYIDIALGHSHKLSEDFTFGVRLKALLGVAYANFLVDRMNVEMNGERWMIDANGYVAAALGGRFTYAQDGMLNGYDGAKFGIRGFGLGVDLGFEYDLTNIGTEGLVMSVSITDLGFMRWKDVSTAGFSPEPYLFEGFDDIALGGAEGTTIEEHMEALGNDLGEMFVLGDKGVADKDEVLSSTLHIGLEYRMPFYDKMSAALLFTNRFNKLYPCHQLSLMLNFSPLKWLNFAISGTNSNLGMGLGAMLNVHCSGFNLFVGTDHFIGKVNKQYIPLKNMNSSVSVGLNIPFGKKR